MTVFFIDFYLQKSFSLFFKNEIWSGGDVSSEGKENSLYEE